MPVADKTAISRPKAMDLIPGYRLDALVGKGGMGEVYRATQLSLGRTVAVKILSSELAKDPAFVARFDKEAAALAALSHPHIVSIVDKGRNQDIYFLVMEYVDGPSLREQMRSPLLDPLAALRMCLEICRAMDYAHSRGVFHRDLKPENILFDEQAGGIPKVSDFGLAGFLDGAPESKFNVTDTHMAMGTGAYMAPEQRIDARSADHRADIYSLGVILYEMLVSELPLGTFDPPSQKKPGVDKRVDSIVARCLKPVPAERYQKVAELIADLEPLVPTTTGVTARKMSAIERVTHRLRRWTRNAFRLVAVVAVAAAAGLLGVALLRARSKPPVERQPGETLVAPLDDRGTTSVAARRDEGPEYRRFTFGEGPDSLSFAAAGRSVVFEGKDLTFPAPEANALAGRTLPVLNDLEGNAVSASVNAVTQVPDTGVWVEVQRFLKGEAPHPSSTLLLMGRNGRFAALTVFGDGREPHFEWELGDNKRGAMLGNRSQGTTRLELSIDKGGRLNAWVGAGKDRRLVGEPVPLPANWRPFFEGVPKPALGCIAGTCTFKDLHYEVERERPPEPPPPPPSEPLSSKPAPKPTNPGHAAPTSKKASSSHPKATVPKKTVRSNP